MSVSWKSLRLCLKARGLELEHYAVMHQVLHGSLQTSARRYLVVPGLCQLGELTRTFTYTQAKPVKAFPPINTLVDHIETTRQSTIIPSSYYKNHPTNFHFVYLNSRETKWKSAANATPSPSRRPHHLRWRSTSATARGAGWAPGRRLA